MTLVVYHVAETRFALGGRFRCFVVAWLGVVAEHLFEDVDESVVVLDQAGLEALSCLVEIDVADGAINTELNAKVDSIHS